MRERYPSKILIAMDGSEASIEVAQYAIALAKKEDNSSLIVLTVANMPLWYVSLSPMEEFSKNWKEKDILESKQWFDDLKRMAEATTGVQLRREFIETAKSVQGAIVEYTECENVDLIVIGTRGRSGFKKLLLSSVAQGVVTYAHCPVMLAR
jgi:nucleotide-binding universal stress UspA family protein